MISVSIFQPNIKELLQNTLEFVRTWEQDSVAFPVLVWYYNLLHRITIFITVIMGVSGIILSTTPIIFYLITGRMVLIFQCFIPYVDYTSHPGFEIHVIFHLVCIFLMVLTLNGTTVIMLLFLVQNCAIIDVIRARLYLLREFIYKTNSSEKEITELLKSIFENHQTLIDFIDNCSV